MSRHWETLAARTDGQNTTEDFETTAYRLVAEQVLYHADKHSRLAYWLVERYTKDFDQVLEPLGIEVKVNALLRYVYAKPRHAKIGTASVAQTLLALVLRSLYDEGMRSGQINDNGEVLCDLVELEEKFRLATGRELPAKMEFDAIVRQFKRWGIAKMADDQNLEELDAEVEPQQCLLIRPAIVEVLGEAALQRLGHWAQHKAVAQADTSPEAGDGEVA